MVEQRMPPACPESVCVCMCVHVNMCSVCLLNLLTEIVTIVNKLNRLICHFAGVNTQRVEVSNVVAANLIWFVRTEDFGCWISYIVYVCEGVCVSLYLCCFDPHTIGDIEPCQKGYESRFSSRCGSFQVGRKNRNKNCRWVIGFDWLTLRSAE